MSNVSGVQQLKETYMPWGESNTNVGSFPQPLYQYTFHEKEQDGTLFYDYGARLYNPAIGRWLSPDTDRQDGLNRYAYVRNNPFRSTDPTGHSSCDAACQQKQKKRSAKAAKPQKSKDAPKAAAKADAPPPPAKVEPESPGCSRFLG